LALPKILMIDRDGTINVRPPHGGYLTRWEDFVWLDDNVAAMVRLAEAGYDFVIISNQAGIGRGIVDLQTVEDVNRQMVAGLRQHGIDSLAVYISARTIRTTIAIAANRRRECCSVRRVSMGLKSAEVFTSATTHATPSLPTMRDAFRC
jgi:histidinol-phosphate phosphatase family protein